MPSIHRKKRAPIKDAPQYAREDFTLQVFEAIAEDLRNGRIPLDRVSITDSKARGLRAIIRKTGNIALHVHYDVGDSRAMIKIGSPDEMSIDEARKLADTIQYLASKGIDVQEGLHEKLIRELKARGKKWVP